MSTKGEVRYFLNVTLKRWCEAVACGCGAHRWQVIEANNYRYLYAYQHCARCGRHRHYFAVDTPEWKREHMK